jgi:2-keto-4-pentenoate hydratase
VEVRLCPEQRCRDIRPAVQEPRPAGQGAIPAWRGIVSGEIEAEIGFRLEDDFDAGDPLAALQTAFVGIEIVRSRLTEAAKAPFPTFVADNIGNGGYVIGPGRDDWRQLDLTGLRCRVWADERLIHDAVGGHPQGDPSLPVRASAQQPIDRLGGLRAGQFVTTGSLCGVIPIDGACRIRVDLEHFGEISVEIGD